MPAKSKAQQRFMGMVHALQKGDIKPSKVSGKVKDVAKSMKKKDAEDFASTKHKNKPYKVKKEVVKKLREIIRQEVESCGYTMSAENPKRKLKSPGGTGPEDRDLKEGKRALKAYNNIHKARNEFIERYSKLRKQLNTLKTESPNNEILRLEKQLYKFEMAFIEQSSKLLGSVSKIAKSNLTEEFNYKRNTPRSLKKSRFKQLDVLVPRGRVNWVIKALKKEIRGIKISHEEVDSYTKDGLVLSKFKKDDINKIMGIVDHAGGLFENKMYKKGDVVKLLSFNRREKGKARVKGVTKARPNKFGIKNHYITNKGTFSDMEVEGTKAFKLRFKGNTEKKVMKVMGLESVNEATPLPRAVGPALTLLRKKLWDISQTHFDISRKFKKPLGHLRKNKEWGMIPKLSKLAQDNLSKVEKNIFGESVNEIRNKREAETLLQQLGGNKFKMMTGAKNFGIDGKSLTFSIGRNSKGINFVRIKLTSRDLYDIEFIQLRAGKVKIKSKAKDVYADQLGKMFKKHTGMNVRLFRETINEASVSQVRSIVKRVKKQSLVNKLRRSRYRIAIKKMNKLIEKKDIKEIKKFFPTFQSELMKVAKTGVVKKKNLSRKISRISQRIKKINK